MEPADRRDAEAQRLAELTGNIIGVCIEVHRAVGPGLLESAYEALVVAARPRPQPMFKVVAGGIEAWERV